MSIEELRKNAALREKHRPKFEANFKTRFIPVYHKKLERLDCEGKYSDAQTQQQFDAYIEGFESAVMPNQNKVKSAVITKPDLEVNGWKIFENLQRSCKHSDMIITIEGASGNGKDMFERMVTTLLGFDDSLKYEQTYLLGNGKTTFPKTIFTIKQRKDK